MIFHLQILVGKTHAKRHTTKQSFMELREVMIAILLEVCHLDDEG